MSTLFPDLYADLVPGITAAGFSLGESFSDVSEKVGRVEWCGPEVSVRDILLGSTSWIGVKRRIGFSDAKKRGQTTIFRVRVILGEP